MSNLIKKKNNNIKKIENSALRILRNFNPPLVSSLSSLGLLVPEFLPFIAIGQSVLSYYGEHANRNTIDLLQALKNIKDEIKQEIIQDDKFKASFIKIVGDNITESNEEKRQLLKNYILNMATGVEPDFNEHTKLINTLNIISLEEVDILKLWDENGVIASQQMTASKRPFYTIGEIQTVIRNSMDGQHLTAVDSFENNDKYNQILLSLSNKDLLYALSERNFGSGQEVRVRDITEFGKIFLRFIKK